ncbi:MAG TPA: carbamoyltransferase HypF [Vicinamibacterales bacterium]|nr:carbamoyltransferase HypF [Vicinamibacterales bacterium]
MPATSARTPPSGRRIEIRGIVQGVGFRPWVYRLAGAHGVGGWVRNDAGGVTIEAFGADHDLDAFVEGLRDAPPPAAHISELTCLAIAGRPAVAFEIVASAPSAERRVSIPADLATCPDCLREIRDPADRRCAYPFTNCTNCGPRFTIAIDIPYDRPNTTMAAFTMCPACQAEYASPADRRFHAQPNACPACGPRLWLAGPDGGEFAATDPIASAAEAISRGLIVAVKGLGGFHLACDAGTAQAVARLRSRKRRDEKPFAVMAADPAAAEAIAVLDDQERRLLSSVERPIVLARRRAQAPIAANVAPGNPLVGVLLPYAPVHHLLAAAARGPLVMTSGNLSEEPLAFRNDEALERLAGVADLFLLHDRDIDTRCDDSVARVVAGAPVVLRRSRGYVPRGIPAPGLFADPVLACGALLKNTFCLGVEGTAFLGPHIGDLENLETFEAYEHAIGRMERFLGTRPAVIAHDLHPDYLSTRYALARPEATKIGVQHHHAHVCAAMAEHGIGGPVIGVAYDGTGLGTDGTAWGGEVLVADYLRFARIATFRPIRLAGGDLAIRQVWRQALALLDDAFGGDAPIDRFPLFGRVGARELATVRGMLAGGVNTPAAHGAGRYFDAVGALGLGRLEARYEGQVAMEWNLVADPDEDGHYAFAIGGGPGLTELDLRPAIRALAGELTTGAPPEIVSARFHNTLAAATVELIGLARRRSGDLPIVLTGGVFQNALLVERVMRAAGPGARVLRHAAVPPGDGGLALGQAVIASAVVQSGRRKVEEDVCA